MSLKEPFTRRDGAIEWLMSLRPGDMPPVTPAGTAPARETSDAELKGHVFKFPPTSWSL
jgi:hypothetical protein